MGHGFHCRACLFLVLGRVKARYSIISTPNQPHTVAFQLINSRLSSKLLFFSPIFRLPHIANYCEWQFAPLPAYDHFKLSPQTAAVRYVNITLTSPLTLDESSDVVKYESFS